MAKALDVKLAEELTCLPAKVGSVMTIGGGVSSRKEVHFPATSTGLPVDMISTFLDIDAGIHCDLSETSVR